MMGSGNGSSTNAWKRCPSNAVRSRSILPYCRCSCSYDSRSILASDSIRPFFSIPVRLPIRCSCSTRATRGGTAKRRILARVPPNASAISVASLRMDSDTSTRSMTTRSMNRNDDSGVSLVSVRFRNDAVDPLPAEADTHQLRRAGRLRNTSPQRNSRRFAPNGWLNIQHHLAMGCSAAGVLTAGARLRRLRGASPSSASCSASSVLMIQG